MGAEVNIMTQQKKRKVRPMRVLAVLLPILVVPLILVAVFRSRPNDAVKNNLLILVNADNPVPKGWEPSLVELSNGERVDERIYPDLQEMFDAMRADGLSVKLRSGYRTRLEQIESVFDYVQEGLDMGYSLKAAKAYADRYVAKPGTSEHELGLSVDINADGGTSPDAVYSWLVEHAAEYGFIQRYPPGKEDITGISTEPWHYRYVGRENAPKIAESGLALEEYLEQNGS